MRYKLLNHFYYGFTLNMIFKLFNILNADVTNNI